MPLFETIPVDVEFVRKLVREHWNVELGDCIKASQNHTFLAKNSDDERFVVRVTPDPKGDRLEPIELEIALLNYLHEHELPVCRPISSSINGSGVVSSDCWIICLFVFATGEPVIYTEWKWMTTKEIVVSLGRWFARLHQLTRKFATEQPALANRARLWNTLHEGVLAEVDIHPMDNQIASDPIHFGIIHGDVNPSNYFWDAAAVMPCMFDWDQLQRSWFLYDLSAPICGVVSLERAGSPIDQSKVPEANSKLYTDWLLEGYESEGDKLTVDRDALQRMVMIRRELYRRFCQKAVLELQPDHPMAQFCKTVADFFAKEEREALEAKEKNNSEN